MADILKLKRISLEKATQFVNSTEEEYVRKKGFKDKGIESAVRPVVIALVAHGFPTQNSCGGHLGSNLYPWVRFQPATTGDSDSALLRHVRRIRSQVEQLGELLDEFWEYRRPPTPDRGLAASLEWDTSSKSDTQVVEEYLATRAKRFVALPGYWLRCHGAGALSTMPGEVIKPYRKSILRHRQQDMLAFGRFLVSKL